MKHFEDYKRVVAIREQSNGNETVGDMWVDTKTFNKDTPISEIIKWANPTGGKLIITIDESDAKYF